MRIMLSLFLLVSALTIVTTNGCGNTGFQTEEVKTMADNVNSMPASNMTEGYRTATFALG